MERLGNIIVPVSAQSFYSAFLYLSLLLSASLLCILLPAIVLRRRARRLRLPPGPRALPFIGHLHLLGADPHQSLRELSSTYGPLMSLRLGSKPIVVASSPAMAKLFLQTHDQFFAGRPQHAVPFHLHSCLDIGYSQPGPFWRFGRQICAADLVGAKKLRSFRPVVAEEMQAMLRSIAADAPQSTHLRPKLYSAAMNIISKMALGKRVEDLVGHSVADPSCNLIALLVEAMDLTGVVNIGDFIPWLAWMDLQGCARRSKAVSRKSQRVWRAIIDTRRQERARSGSSKKDDFLDTLLSASERKDMQITDKHVMGILHDVFAGGIGTSTISVEWALAELLTHPVIMKKVQDELHKVVGDSRLVEESDIQNLPYLQAIVKETMRLHPVSPLLAPHMATQQCKVEEFDIPSNTYVYVNIWAIGRDEGTWNRPLEFLPDRFINSKVDMRGQDFELLPFGSGRRMCPGMLLGINNVHMMLASLLQAFEWTIDEKIDVKEKYGIVMSLSTPIVAKSSLRVSENILKK